MTTTKLDKTAAEFRALAIESSQRSADSFERCDTDGFLSQWASDSMSSLYRFAAELVEAGSTYNFTELFDTEGNHLPDAKLVNGRYGQSWMIPTAHGVSWFNPSKAQNPERRRATDAKKGYQEGLVRRPAAVKLVGNLTLYPIAVPDQDSDEFEIVSTSHYTA